MSTDWHLRCTTCQVRNFDEIKNAHGRNSLASVLELLPSLYVIACYPGYGDIECSIAGYGSAAINFAVKHHDHTLVIESEYGDIYDPATDTVQRATPGNVAPTDTQILDLMRADPDAPDPELVSRDDPEGRRSMERAVIARYWRMQRQVG